MILALMMQDEMSTSTFCDLHSQMQDVESTFFVDNLSLTLEMLTLIVENKKSSTFGDSNSMFNS